MQWDSYYALLNFYHADMCFVDGVVCPGVCVCVCMDYTYKTAGLLNPELVSCSVVFILSSEVPRERRPKATPHLHVVPRVTMLVIPPSLHALALLERRRCLWARWDSPVTLTMFYQSTLQINAQNNCCIVLCD